ncbi:hypothetical protein NBRC116495_14570 [Aurantivibrio plasticivorans]
MVFKFGRGKVFEIVYVPLWARGRQRPLVGKWNAAGVSDRQPLIPMFFSGIERLAKVE